MIYSKVIVSKQKEESTSIQRVNVNMVLMLDMLILRNGFGHYHYIGRDARKSVFGVSDIVRLKLVSSATVTR